MGFRRLVAACSVAIIGLGVSACGSEGDGPVAGELIAAAHSEQFKAGAKARVLVPTGALLVWAGAPVQRVGADETRDRTVFEAAPGTSYVPITWRYNTSRFDKISNYLNTDATPTVDLQSGEHSYRLPPPSRHTRVQSFYVVVDGDAEDITLAVGFDGVTQTVDLRTGKRKAHQARGLYDLDELDLKAKPCSTQSWFSGEFVAARFKCDIVGPLLLPYADGRWADAGHRWLAVGLSTSLGVYSTSDGIDGAHWRGSSVKTKLTLGGKRSPDAVIRADNTDDICPDERDHNCKYSARAIFEVGKEAPDSLRVRQTYDLELAARWGNYVPPENLKARAEGVIRLR